MGKLGSEATSTGSPPPQWSIVPFEEAVLKVPITVAKIRKRDYKQVGYYPVVDQGREFIAGYSDDGEGLYEGPLPVIIFGDHTRIFKYIDFPFFAGADGVRVLLPNADAYQPLFLFYLLSSLDIPNRGYNRHFTLLREMRLVQPPLQEQRAIADVLRSVQQAREATEAVIVAARELKRSLMRHLFTYGPVPLQEAERVPLKETEIGRLPQHWRVEPLGDAVQLGDGSIQTGPFGSLLHASDYVPTGVPVIMPRDMTAAGRIVVESIAHVRDEDADRLSRYRVQAGDLLVARRGELGRRGLVTSRQQDWLCGTGCLRVRPGRDLLSSFLSSAFQTDGIRNWLAANAIGTTMANLSAEILGRMPVPLPPLADQEEVGRVLEGVDGKIESEEKQRSVLEELFESLLHQLMTGQVRLYTSEAGGAMA